MAVSPISGLCFMSSPCTNIWKKIQRPETEGYSMTHPRDNFTTTNTSGPAAPLPSVAVRYSLSTFKLACMNRKRESDDVGVGQTAECIFTCGGAAGQ